MRWTRAGDTAPVVCKYRLQRAPASMDFVERARDAGRAPWRGSVESVGRGRGFRGARPWAPAPACPEPLGAMPGRQRHGGARADFPAHNEDSRGMAACKNAPDRSRDDALTVQ